MGGLASSRLIFKRLENLDSFGKRFELKFCLPTPLLPELRRRLPAYAAHDSYCADTPGNEYQVKSIYFDSEDLDFYYEKLDGVRTRKKLRVRGYQEVAPNQRVFLEIKRKYDRTVTKERVQLELSAVESALNGDDPSLVMQDRDYRDRKVFDRFRYNVKARGLSPVVLIFYHREAFVGLGDSSQRVTFDRDLRSLAADNRLDFDRSEDFVEFEPGRFILELKFNEHMPKWMADLVKEFDLRQQAYSKYCEGLRPWMEEGKVQPDRSYNQMNRGE